MAEPAAIGLAGRDFLADPAGALFWPAQSALIVADLHLEKGSSFARRRQFLPPYDTGATLARLGAIIARYEPRRVLCLGDSFHDGGGPDRLDQASQECLRALQAGREWIWVAGNHDPDLPGALGGRMVEAVTLAGVTFRHVPQERARGPEVAGHLHPAARLRHRGATVRRKCFAGDGQRLVLPALGAYAGGLDVLDPAFRSLFPSADFLVWMLGNARVYRLSSRRLVAA